MIYVHEKDFKKCVGTYCRHITVLHPLFHLSEKQKWAACLSVFLFFLTYFVLFVIQLKEKKITQFLCLLWSLNCCSIDAEDREILSQKLKEVFAFIPGLMCFGPCFSFCKTCFRTFERLKKTWLLGVVIIRISFSDILTYLGGISIKTIGFTV